MSHKMLPKTSNTFESLIPRERSRILADSSFSLFLSTISSMILTSTLDLSDNYGNFTDKYV